MKRTPDEIAILRAFRAVCYACWAVKVIEALSRRDLTSSELGEIVGANSYSSFWGWLQRQKIAKRVGTRPSPKGHPVNIWRLERVPA